MHKATMARLALICVWLAGCQTNDDGLADVQAPMERSHERQIAQIEAALRPAYGVVGEQSETWSLLERMEHYRVPAVSIAVAIDGELAWARAYGTTRAGSANPVDTDTLFQTASLSKPVASLVALKLVEEGVLSLDEPVNGFLKRWKIDANAFTSQTPVTLRHLMSHRAGTTIHGFRGYQSDDPLPTLVQILNGEFPANTDPVVVTQRPGQAYRYSGGGFTIIQLLIEDVSGATYADEVARHVLQPTQMTRSSFDYPPTDNNVASGHVGPDSQPIPSPGIRYLELAAAGLWSTPSELVTLGAAIARARNSGGDLLDQQLAQALVPDSADEPGLGFGLHNSGDGVAFVHNGHNPGYSARWINYADGRANVAVLTNADNGGELIREIYSAIGYAYGWTQDGFVERETVRLEPLWMNSVAGDYAFNADSKQAVASISVVDDELWIEGQLVERTRLHALTNQALFVTRGLNFAVEIDASGEPVALNVENEIRLLKMRPQAP